jgi:hypothetical protein
LAHLCGGKLVAMGRFAARSRPAKARRIIAKGGLPVFARNGVPAEP